MKVVSGFKGGGGTYEKVKEGGGKTQKKNPKSF